MKEILTMRHTQTDSHDLHTRILHSNMYNRSVKLIYFIKNAAS
jgi:hypothetical protein